MYLLKTDVFIRLHIHLYIHTSKLVEEIKLFLKNDVNYYDKQFV